MTSATIRPIHCSTPGRIRYEVPRLRRRPDLVAKVEERLGRQPGVRGVQGSARTGTLLITYEPSASKEDWSGVLGRLIGATVTVPDVPCGPNAASTPHSKRPRRLPAERVLRVKPYSGSRATTSAPEGVSQDAKAPPFHTMLTSEAFKAMCSAPDGLAQDEAMRRLERDGPNVIPPPPRRSELRILVDQLANTPVAMLGVSSALSAATGGVGDAAAILAVVGINAGIGYATESGAERTIASLTCSPQQSIVVLRDGVARTFSNEQLVFGDVVVLQAGVFVPADARVLNATDLSVDESSLTGESVPTVKEGEPVLELDTPLGDRCNMVYRGTLVTGGSGLALVTATGVRTELGRIQQLAANVEARATPMQRQLEQLSRQLAWGAGAACLGMLGLGLLRGHALVPMLRTAVSLGVAAVPEGLPTVAMTTLALGLARMRDERVLVRKLAAVETLGATQIVCLDKTGTLTINRMTVVALQAGLALFDVREGACAPFSLDQPGSLTPSELEPLLSAAVLCNEVFIEHQDGVTTLRGSATEAALVQAALDFGVDVGALRERHPVRSVQRRAQGRSYMSSVHASERGELTATKGNPSEVLTLCTHALRHGRCVELGDAERALIAHENETLATRGLRVLGFAMQGLSIGDDRANAAYVWLGLMGMEDPPRPFVSEMLASLRGAGVRTIMITGDQSATARAIGEQIGLGAPGLIKVTDSKQLDAASAQELASLAQSTQIFSRVSPAHKLLIVRTLQDQGYVVAMTGDGINDGPALRAADIGIAMGAGGTLAARELADIVLEDDELGTLIHAVQQGRTIYDDIRKAVRFILATNFSELVFTFSCVAMGIGEPLSPIQLLWINLLTDIFPELALATQPPESDVLSRPPRDPQRPMFTASDMKRVAFEGTVITSAALAAYVTTLRRAGPGPRANTVAFSTLMFAQLLHAFSARSESYGIFDRQQVPTNRWLPISIGATAVLQLITSFVSPLRGLLGVVPLGPSDWMKVLLGTIGPFLINEASKPLWWAQRPLLASTEG
ncbi:MAG: ATPase, P-type (transporting), superfamily, subfamily [Myxococcaceae bacterium]|nr:ATPase, P-type (transporting), superfamily, subfamily [Myxococcaceae bacterium]